MTFVNTRQNKKKKRVREWTLDDEVKLGSIGVRWQVKPFGLDRAPDNGGTGAEKLGVVGVPGLSQASLRMDAVVGFQGVQVLQLALVELALLGLLRPSQARTKQHKAKGSSE